VHSPLSSATRLRARYPSWAVTSKAFAPEDTSAPSQCAGRWRGPGRERSRGAGKAPVSGQPQRWPWHQPSRGRSARALRQANPLLSAAAGTGGPSRRWGAARGEAGKCRAVGLGSCFGARDNRTALSPGFSVGLRASVAQLVWQAVFPRRVAGVPAPSTCLTSQHPPSALAAGHAQTLQLQPFLITKDKKDVGGRFLRAT